MNPLKRTTLGAILILGFGPGLWADEGFRPRFEAGTSLIAGTSYELVLRDGTYNNPVSRLTWPILPSLALDTAVELPWQKWTSTRLAVRAAFPILGGTLVDEDWNASTTSGTLVYGKSEHTALMTSNLAARIEESFFWESLRFDVGLLYRWMSWEGWNGTGEYTYASGTSSLTYSGLMIAYRQQWIIPYLGAAWTVQAPGWTFTPSLRFGPYSWCSDMDNHNYAGTTTKTFLDYTAGGWYAQTGLEAEVPGGPGWTMGVRGSAEVHWGAIGSTITTTSQQSLVGTTYTYPSTDNASGTWYYEAGLTFFVRN